jgi:hypothetical protein
MRVVLVREIRGEKKMTGADVIVCAMTVPVLGFFVGMENPNSYFCCCFIRHSKEIESC